MLYRLTLVGVLVSLCLSLKAQVTPSDSVGAAPPAGAAADQTTPTTTDLFPSFTPKSPSVTGLGRFGEYPVSMYTGVPTIEIPLFEFKVGTLTVPIKLSYHAGGLKVNQVASWVGMGWSLQTGGMITRTVLGRPDEQGVLGQAIPDPGSSYNPNCPTDASDVIVANLADNVVDTQRDLFTYQTPRGSNTFMLLPSSPGVALLKSEPVVITHNNVATFTLFDDQGIYYRFEDGEASASNQSVPNGYAGYTSAWYLNEIISATSSERAVYTYTAPINQPMAPEPVYTTIIQADLNDYPANTSGIPTGFINTSRFDAAVSVAARFPQEIQFPGGKIRFVLESGNRPDGIMVLDYLDIFAYDVNNSQFALIKRYDLLYVNKARTDGNTVTFLSGINLIGSDRTTILGNYSFDYNDDLPLPSAAGNQKDYWGYYNSNTGTTLIPVQPNLPFQLNYNSPGLTYYQVGDANRDPNPDKMPAWILKTIHYPTGGYTQFDFEANRYYDNGGKIAGGLRVKQIRSYTTNNQLATQKNYLYGVNESGFGTFRTDLRPSLNNVQSILRYSSTVGAVQYSYKVYSYSSAPTYPLTPNEGSPVTYPEVAEYQVDAATNTNGKTVYRFRDDAVDGFFHVGNKSFVTSRSWDRGQLISQTQYDQFGNIRAQSQTGYTSFGQTSTTATVGVFVVRSTKHVGDVPNVNGCNQYDDAYLPFQTYYFSSGTTLPTSTSQISYSDDNNAGSYSLNVTQTDYDPSFYLTRERRQQVGGGVILGTQFVYPQDFGLSIPNSADNALLGIRAMQNRNLYLPVEQVQYRQETSGSTKAYKSGQLTTYAPISMNGFVSVFPNQKYLLESTLTSFSASAYQSSASRYLASSNGNSLLVDPRYALRWNAIGYDGNGNLQGYFMTGGAITTLGYTNYTPTGGMPFSVLSTQTLNAGQTGYQLTSYAYALPLLGPSSITDPRNVNTAYEYDNFGRLIIIRDTYGRVLKQYSYHYSTQP